MRLVLGIDTSNYTTSICLVDEFGEIVFENRKILDVASGSRGLRQSEALFQHVRNLPALTSGLNEFLQQGELVAVAVASKPRPTADSYMPVFLPGLALGQTLGNLLGIPCYELSHQEGHIWAGIASARGPKQFPFLAIHLSGGTTELTFVNQKQDGPGLAIDFWGGSTDLHAGQFVDRLGVALGLQFPAGPTLEKLAKDAQTSLSIPTFHKEGSVSFSGPLTALERLVGVEKPEVLAASCIAAIGRTLIKWIKWAEDRTTCRQLLIVGGVAANQLLRTQLTAGLRNWDLYFASPAYSVDNAYGSAYFGLLVSGLLPHS